jgi:hypothetical protein
MASGGTISRSDDLSDSTLCTGQLLCSMNQTPAKAQAISLWRELNLTAHRAEMLVATASLEHARGVGGPPPEGLVALARELRGLANRQRELALFGLEASAVRRFAGEVDD